MWDLVTVWDAFDEYPGNEDFSWENLQKWTGVAIKAFCEEYEDGNDEEVAFGEEAVGAEADGEVTDEEADGEEEEDSDTEAIWSGEEGQDDDVEKGETDEE